MTTIEVSTGESNPEETANTTGAVEAATVAANAAAEAVETLAEAAQSAATQELVDEAVQEALTLERIGNEQTRMWQHIFEQDAKIDQIAAAAVASQQVMQVVAAEVEAALDAPAAPEAEAVEETPPPAAEAPVKKSKWV